MDKALKIDFQNDETYWLNGDPIEDAPYLPGHIWLKSSGTSGKQKWVALSKKAILASAQSVNTWIHSTQEDVWWLGLPTYHVGGLAILARASLSGAKITQASSAKWDPEALIKDIEQHKVTLLSLVPTQIYDLVQKKRTAPKSVRVVFVGGGALAQDLYEQAKQLGWPLLCTFGMTETSSMIACHRPENEMKTSEFFILPHAEVKAVDQVMWVKAPSLLTGQLERSGEGPWQYTDPKKDGWLPTEDLIELKDDRVILKGRQSNSVKVLGELVQIEEVENNFRNFVMQINPALLDKYQITLSSVPDARQENALALFIEGKTFSWKLWMQSLSQFNQTQQGPWRIDRMAWVKQLPRNAMGKVQRQQLIHLDR